jgi:hypothetical protein
MKVRYKLSAFPALVVKIERHMRAENDLENLSPHFESCLADRIASFGFAVDQFPEEMTDDSVTRFSGICHEFANFIFDKSQSAFEVLSVNRLLDQLIRFILQFGQSVYQFCEDGSEYRIVLPALEVFCSFLCLDTTRVCEIFLDAPALVELIDTSLVSEHDEDLLFYCLTIIGLVSYDLIQLKVHFSNVFNCPISRLFELFGDFGPNSKLWEILLIALRFICESDQGSALSLEIVVVLLAIDHVSVYCLALFTILYRFIVDCPVAVCETPQIRDFFQLRFPDLVCPPEFGENDTWKRISNFALKILLKTCSVIPELANELVELVPIDDLVTAIGQATNEKWISRALNFLHIRCSQPESSWVAFILLDAKIDHRLHHMFLNGSYRLKAASIRLWSSIFPHQHDSSCLNYVLTLNFMEECLAVLEAGSVDLIDVILQFWIIVFDSVCGDAIPFLGQLMDETGFGNGLERLALDSGPLGEVASLVINKVKSILPVDD